METSIAAFREKGWAILPFRDVGLVGQIMLGLEELLEAPEGVRRRWELDRTELFPQRGLVLSNERAGCGSLTFQYSRKIRDQLCANGADVDARADWMNDSDQQWMRGEMSLQATVSLRVTPDRCVDTSTPTRSRSTSRSRFPLCGSNTTFRISSRIRHACSRGRR